MFTRNSHLTFVPKFKFDSLSTGALARNFIFTLIVCLLQTTAFATDSDFGFASEETEYSADLRSPDNGDPSVVSNVDLQRYAGFWYEIAHNPTFFQTFCERSTAQYGLIGPGQVSVLNTCYRNNQPWSKIEGKANVVNPNAPGKLIVDFGWFRRGDYWIVALDKNYEWSVVSGPGKNSIFILARKAPMSKAVLERILSNLNERGFDTSRLIFDKY